jgi:hypothetical protein
MPFGHFGYLPRMLHLYASLSPLNILKVKNFPCLVFGNLFINCFKKQTLFQQFLFLQVHLEGGDMSNTYYG